MTELEKIVYAKSFIDKLADGINPVDDTPVPEGDVVNNVRLSRCFFYVPDILRQVIENKGVCKTRKKKKLPFSITYEKLSKYQFSSYPISVTEIVKHINELVDTENMTALKYSDIVNYLIQIDFLRNEKKADGKHRKVPTEEGMRIGIFTEMRTGLNGQYMAVLYNREAQQFIIDNMDAIMALMNK